MVIKSNQLVGAAKQLIREITPEVLFETKNDYILIDVREKDELCTGKLADAIHIPRGTLEMNIEKQLTAISDDNPTTMPLVLYCRSGARSALATQTLQQMGFTNVQSLQGGIINWKEANFPLIPLDC